MEHLLIVIGLLLGTMFLISLYMNFINEGKEIKREFEIKQVEKDVDDAYKQVDLKNLDALVNESNKRHGQE